jgi:hypothetical protein
MIRAAVLGALLAAASSTLHAQAGREEFREAARTCRYAAPAEQRTCMAFELCKTNRDPQRCEQRYFVNMERRDLVLEACKGKQGTVLNNCMRDGYKTLGTAPRLEACDGLLGAPLRDCVREEYRNLPPPPPKRG